MTRLDDRESQLEQDLEELENDITKMTHTIKSLHRANRKEQAKIDMQKLLAKRMRIQMIKKEMAGITQQKTFIEMHASGEEQSKIARDFAAVTRQFVGESRLNDLDVRIHTLHLLILTINRERQKMSKMHSIIKTKSS